MKEERPRPAAPFRFRPGLERLDDRWLPSTVTNANDAGPGSLRQAILDSNASRGVVDTIAFAIPGAGPHTITPGATNGVATGDFSVREAKVQPVLSALAANLITATAVHTHLIGETPKIYYIHFWGDGPLADVLTGLRAALDAAK